METNNTGTYTDQRDGKQYKWVKIGAQIWMTENLAYKVETGCWAYDNDSSNVSKYGYLYDLKTARNACLSADGWRLPTKSDFEKLLQNTGDSYNTRYDALIQNGSSGFEALNAGWRALIGNFSYLDEYATFLSATPDDEKNVWVLYLDGMNAYPFGLSKDMGFSVRCVKDF